MALVGICGEKSDVNKALLMYACDHGPSLVIDSGYAHPHALFSDFAIEKFSDVYMVQCELSFAFLDIVKRLHRTATELMVKTIVVTPFDHLFYPNEEEGEYIMEYVWVMLSKLAVEYNVVVTVNDDVAKKYCNLLLPVHEWVLEVI